MADAGDRDAGGVEATFTALRGAENPADVFCPGRASRTETAACPSIRFPLFMELLGSRMPSACWGSSKQSCMRQRPLSRRWNGLGGMACGRAVCEPGAAMFGSARKPVDADGAIPWG